MLPFFMDWTYPRCVSYPFVSSVQSKDMWHAFVWSGIRFQGQGSSLLLLIRRSSLLLISPSWPIATVILEDRLIRRRPKGPQIEHKSKFSHQFLKGFWRTALSVGGSSKQRSKAHYLSVGVCIFEAFAPYVY